MTNPASGIRAAWPLWQPLMAPTIPQEADCNGPDWDLCFGEDEWTTDRAGLGAGASRTSPIVHVIRGGMNRVKLQPWGRGRAPTGDGGRPVGDGAGGAAGDGARGPGQRVAQGRERRGSLRPLHVLQGAGAPAVHAPPLSAT